MIERLLQDHDKMRRLAAELREILERDRAGDLDRLAELRWDMASTIMSHVAFEDRAFYSKIEADPDDGIRALALEFREDLHRRFGDYTSHTKGWTPGRIARDWYSYRLASLRFLDWLLKRAHREETELFPLIRAGMVDSASRNLTPVSWARDAFAMKDSIHGV